MTVRDSETRRRESRDRKGADRRKLRGFRNVPLPNGRGSKQVRPTIAHGDLVA
jgi:hypothetical protein